MSLLSLLPASYCYLNQNQLHHHQCEGLDQQQLEQTPIQLTTSVLLLRYPNTHTKFHQNRSSQKFSNIYTDQRTIEKYKVSGYSRFLTPFCVFLIQYELKERKKTPCKSVDKKRKKNCFFRNANCQLLVYILYHH